MPKPKKENTNLIKCKHGWQPWNIVCIHLIEGKSREWKAIPTEKPGFPDWFCPECYDRFEEIMKNKELKDLRPVCIQCVEYIRSQYDPKYLGVEEVFKTRTSSGEELFIKFRLDPPGKEDQ